MTTLNTTQFNSIMNELKNIKPNIYSSVSVNSIALVYDFLLPKSQFLLTFTAHVDIKSMGQYTHTPFRAELPINISKFELALNNIKFTDAIINHQKFNSITFAFMEINGQIAMNIHQILNYLNLSLKDKTIGLNDSQIINLINSNLNNIISNNNLILKI